MKKVLIFCLFTVGLIFSLIGMGFGFYTGFVNADLGWLPALGLCGLSLVGGVLGIVSIKLEMNDYYIGKFVTRYIWIMLLLLGMALLLTPVGLLIYRIGFGTFSAVQLLIAAVAWLQGALCMLVLAQLS